MPGEPQSNGTGTFLFLGVAGGALAVVWAGAELAALLRGDHLAAGLAPAFHALVRLPSNAQDPRRAWGPPWEASLPGPVLYWASTIVWTFALLVDVRRRRPACRAAPL